jgi:hypothetical protein
LEDPVRRFPVIVAAASCMLVLGIGPVAQAAPPDNHFTDTGSFTDPDFCGTGESVTTTFSAKGTFHDSGDGTGFVTVRGTDTLTAESTGEQVIAHFANRVVDEFVDNGDGTVTFSTTFTGLPEQFRLKGGGVITRDAGIITLTTTFDEETGEVISEDVTFRGPHPQAESGFGLFCQVIPEALGIA